MLAAHRLLSPPGSLERVARFAMVGASGLLVNSAALAVASGTLGLHYLLGTILATQASTLWNFLGSEHLVFTSSGYRLNAARRLVRFAAVNNAFLVTRGPFVVLLTAGLGLHYLVSNLATLLASFVIRYFLADRFIWRPASVTAAVASPPSTLRKVEAAPDGARGAGTMAPSPAVLAWGDRVDGEDRPAREGARGGLPRWVFPAVTALGLLAMVTTRLWAIGAFGYNSDEAVYAGQGLTLVGDPVMATHFSLFRAHPLLLQLVVGVAFQLFGTVDVVGRVAVAVIFGCGSVAGCYLLAARLYGRRVAVVAALMLAVLPYHVIVSRQVMVDTPMGFFVVLSAWLLARYVTGGRAQNLIVAFAALGLAVLSKETAILALFPMALTLLAHQRWALFRNGTAWAAALLFAAVISPFPATRLINQPGKAGEFFLWQFLRKPNHPPDYFLRVLLQFAGPVFLALLVVGAVVLLRRRDTRDVLVLSWMGTFFVFFNLWPTKLFPYLFPILPMMAITAALGLERAVRAVAARWDALAARQTAGFVLAGVAAAAVLAVGTVSTLGAGPAAQVPGLVHFDIEVQTFAGGREVGEWLGDNTPANAKLLTIGPSIGNIVRFYGDRDSVALSVSADPRRRNPAYVPVTNPDFAIRNMDVQYALWDAYSADRSAFYNARLMRYVRKYQGVPIYTVYVDEGGRMRTTEGDAPEGTGDVRLVVFDLQGGNPAQRIQIGGGD